ncbi:MAG: hypothetical protein WA738_17615 [Candidatus Angelobacter sp.]
MNRRKLLKALATVPVASALGVCKMNDDDRSRRGSSAHRLQILLDGAFAVVIQHDKANSIFAFSPRDKSEPHQFYFNDPKYVQESGKNYDFELLLQGLKKNERPEIASGFEDFNAETKRWTPTENFVAIKLPCPRRITFAGHRERVKFLSKKEGWMPTNHILEYEVSDPGQVRLECKELAKSCAPSKDSPEGLMRFFFEVGPPEGTPENHAVSFFNYMLKTSFPDLVDRYSLESIDDKRGQPRTTARVLPAVMSETMEPLQLRPVSYTLDCKLGGLIVGTP